MDIKDIYQLRNDFSIIGLTGRTGSGCTRFAEIISKPVKFENDQMLRKPIDIEFDKDVNGHNTVFKRKYEICYDYFKNHHNQYETIHYISVVLFYSLHYLVKRNQITTSTQLIDGIESLLKLNFKKSTTGRDENYFEVDINRDEIEGLSDNFNELLSGFQSLNDSIIDVRDLHELDDLHNVYWSDGFKKFSTKFYDLLGKRDYYLGSFFVHRLGNKIRATGNPLLEDANLKKCAETKYTYTLAELINRLIKAWKKRNGKCHICVDSLRNSLEIMFFKERYSAFYMIAIHNEDRHLKRIENRVKKRNELDTTGLNTNDVVAIIEKVIELDNVEHGVEDFKDGHFFAPDVENCIQKSEIHINNPGDEILTFKDELRKSDFYTMIEQWMKIHALISHPGLITPSQEERCMQIAYNSKFNSGCISRQVGAVITDEFHSIRSVGWNDVPKGSVPCNLRDLADIIDPTSIHPLDESYSSFEKDQSEKQYKNGGTFSIKSKDAFAILVPKTREHGLNHSFCFKSLHNKYENKENQVHTRSLHAEENAMLQIAKYGGQPLKNGTLYTTASPCELCAKKAYQLGMRRIIYIDPYPGISMKHILDNGHNRPVLKMFTGIIGKAYDKLFEPFLSYKDELSIIHRDNSIEDSSKDLKSSLEELFNVKIDCKLSNSELQEKLKEIIK